MATDGQSGTGSPPAGALRTMMSGRARGAVAIGIATVALFVISAIVAPQSVSGGAISAMLPFAAILAVVAIGQTLVVQQGGIDLSVPGVFSLSVVVVTKLASSGTPGAIFLALVAALLISAAAGAVSGFVVARFDVAPIVATLGVNALLIGTTWAVSSGAARRTPAGLSNIIGSSFAGVPVTVIVAVVLTVVVGLFVRLSPAGRKFEAVGASPRVATAAGIRPLGYTLTAYSGAAVLYAIAGILLTGIVNTPGINEGNTYLLPSVAAVVLGGTSLLGGKGSVLASLIAALFFTQVDRLASTLGLSYGWQIVIQALALGLGVAFHSGLRPGATRRRRTIEKSRELVPTE
ncbi:ribose ABC transporter [Rhodococcoides trifolii]|uniref:Ribose ABC transporter n=1 Tax=Rhodococcoides trifolii TaxID=908250 RepID=A0A917LEJ7_9NOCA|nr:ABC transporter permease [Rhodococcus trifolii]GGG16276.1 ribose ABC transporter [Rhodococcus trifolii]